MPNFCLPVLALVAASLLNAQSYRDSSSGVEVLEFVPSTLQPTNLYFHFSNFTADNRFVIFAGTEGAHAQIYAYDVASRQIAPVTTGAGVSASSACPHPTNASILYYLRGPRVYELNLVTRNDRLIGEIPEPRTGGYQQPTLSHDGKSLALTKQRDAANWEIGLMDLATGAWRTVITQGFRIGHVQHHPKLPIIFYVWETGGFAPQRTWLVNDDGSANRPFYYTTDPKQWITPLKEWATHEAWIRETGDMTIIIDKVGIVIADPSGKGRLLPGDYWHVAARPDGKKLVADDSKGNLWLIDAATDSRRLLATGLRDSVRAVHAHASFDRTGRYVLFNSGRTRQTIALIDLSTLAP
ncbi:MAG: hypothetical protein IPP47_25185 [Bryobacterales bacterium]|nr:hypothetical protein [Bryobacterales bacterium]